MQAQKTQAATAAVELKPENLSLLGKSLRVPAYDRDKLACGIVHMSVGGFHRSHQALYIDDLLAKMPGDWMISAIGLQSEYFDGARMVRSKPDGGLKKLADETGGGYFELKKTADLGPTFSRVAQELHSQYVLGFEPKQLDGKVHKLTVKMKQMGMTARARKSYVAAAAREDIRSSK